MGRDQAEERMVSPFALTISDKRTQGIGYL